MRICFTLTDGFPIVYEHGLYHCHYRRLGFLELDITGALPEKLANNLRDFLICHPLEEKSLQLGVNPKFDPLKWLQYISGEFSIKQPAEIERGDSFVGLSLPEGIGFMWPWASQPVSKKEILD